MATAESIAEKIVAFDGDCPMCTSTIRLLMGLKLLKPEQARAIHDLDRADFDAVYAAGIRNQLVVIDPVTREARSGTDGLLWILRENTGNHFLVRLLALPGVRDLLRWGYQIVSYNRRIISPPRHRIVCDCEPEVTLARRLSLMLPLLAFTILITAGCGAAVFRGWGPGDEVEWCAVHGNGGRIGLPGLGSGLARLAARKSGSITWATWWSRCSSAHWLLVAGEPGRAARPAIGLDRACLRLGAGELFADVRHAATADRGTSNFRPMASGHG